MVPIPNPSIDHVAVFEPQSLHVVFRFLYFISCQCVGTSKIPALLDGTRSFAASLTWSMSQKGNVAPGVVWAFSCDTNPESTMDQ